MFFFRRRPERIFHRPTILRDGGDAPQFQWADNQTKPHVAQGEKNARTLSAWRETHVYSFHAHGAPVSAALAAAAVAAAAVASDAARAALTGAPRDGPP